MPAQLLDGNALARQIRSELAVEVVDFIENNGVIPSLAAVLVGDDPASQVYVRNKRRDCEEVGIQSTLHRLPSTTTQEELLNVIAKLNRDETAAYVWLDPSAAEGFSAVPTEKVWAITWTEGATIVPVALLTPAGQVTPPRLTHLLPGAPRDTLAPPG